MTTDQNMSPFSDDELSALLRAVDHPVPAMSAGSVVARARRQTRANRWLRRAAVVVVCAGTAGAAFALPGSPIRGWVGELMGRAPREAPLSEPARVAPRPAQASAGVAVDPGDDIIVEITGRHDGARLSVELVDTELLAASTATGSAGFVTGDTGLIVDVRAVGSIIDLRVPRTAPRVRVVSEGRLLFELRDGIVRVPGATNGPFEIGLD